MSCGIGCRCGSNPAWLWLWRRPAAIASIGPLAWEPPYAAGPALEKAKKTKKKKKKEAPIMKSSQNFTVTPVCQSLVSLVIMGSLLSICENLDLRKDLPDLPQGREAQCRSGPGGPKAGWILTVSFLPP